MLGSLRALLTDVIDYAGLFPPAKLEMEPAIRNYARYRVEPESWMLSRFVCPASRLAELADFVNLFHERPPFRFSVLGPGAGATTSSEFTAALEADFASVRRFLEKHGDNVVIEGVEVRLPADITNAAEVDAIRNVVETTAGTAREIAGAASFFEVASPTAGFSGAVPVARVLAAYNAEDTKRPRTGLKLRTGGVEATAFPSVQAVASMISLCLEHRVALKFTAGLHHPIRHFDETIGASIHGFVNVFAASVLAHRHHLQIADIAAVLDCEDPAAFEFSNEHLAYARRSVPTDEITAIRKTAVISFGSCSFNEPREDLLNLGWL